MRPTPASVRFPPALRERLQERAQQERRSFSQQVVLLAERGLAAAEAEAEEIERLHSIYRDTVAHHEGAN